MIWAQMDTVILSVIVGINVLAGYNFAARLQSAASYPQSLSAAAVVPASANLLALESRESAFDELLIRGTRYSLELSLPVTIAAMILARPLLIYWVGDAYASFAGPAQLFLTYQLVSCTAGIANTMLVGMGRVRAVTIYVTIAMVMNLGLSIALARPLGVSGVIIGTLVGYGITAPLYIRLVLRELTMGLGEFLASRDPPDPPVGCRVRRGGRAHSAFPARRPASSQWRCAACPPRWCTSRGSSVFAMTREERSALLGFLLPAPHAR